MVKHILSFVTVTWISMTRLHFVTDLMIILILSLSYFYLQSKVM